MVEDIRGEGVGTLQEVKAGYTFKVARTWRNRKHLHDCMIFCNVKAQRVMSNKEK